MSYKPLAELLRPLSLDEYIGQTHLIGKGSVLRNAIEADNIPSMILWGPPGVGKTTLANIISHRLMRPFYKLSAICSGVKEVRQVIEQAQKEQGRAILFIDEIHRFSKSQQDSLLGAVEQGIITFIGATTENPSFEIISPLLSRCQIYILKHLEKEDLLKLLEIGRKNLEKQTNKQINLKEKEALLRISGGDARKLYNSLQLVVNSIESSIVEISHDLVLSKIQQNIAMYDKTGENHYDIISAFIKSIRGSDPNASVYWLARMIEGGEEPKFIARRMLILASEDIGNANPNALLLASECFNAVNVIGYPESRIILSQTAIYLATSPKSNASYQAINKAQQLVKKTGNLPVPLALRNASSKLMQDIGYGNEYKYAHNYVNNFVELEFLPQQIAHTKLYDPGNNPREKDIRKRMKFFWKDKYCY